ncbi:hypothetical protein NLJ89_g6840 [Agrocybe chaxingu]|uniref:BTB domain-containing protein n=1 Tax=Agrocybe chaxingu TaxID=84603 RepID=A0A9W8K041_9AGAR|nr:hypothetical protein NLJ89_g6840 [Agrocybe chaxingu]
MAQLVSVAPNTPPAPSLQEATRNSTQAWQTHLESLFHHAKDRFPDVVWEFVAEGADEQDPEDYGPSSVMAKLSNGPGLGVIEEVWGHKAIVYARAPPSFQSRYFRPIGGAPSPLPYPAESNLSLGYADPSTSTPALGALSPSFNNIHQPDTFSNELEYLYTGKGFGEAFEFLFDSSEAREHGLLTNGSAGEGSEVDEAEALRIDKLRKDLVFMWRSRLYSDVRLALTGNFGGSHESTTAIFSSHRFILVSRCSYFHTALIAWPTKTTGTNGEPPTLNLPSPPFTPASLHFTLGFIYTGTLVFSHRSYDLSTAFAILRAALYLTLPSLQDEIQARIAQEMCHGLFHAFLPFSEYESITGGRWGTGGCRCRQCARRAPRVLEFALAEDVRNTHLERGARRALVGLFGEGWCNVEFASLPQKIRDSVVRGVGKRTISFECVRAPLGSGACLSQVGVQHRRVERDGEGHDSDCEEGVDECVAKEAEQCFESEEWMEIVESEGARFEDGERVEWAMKAVLRGVKEGWAALLYQTLVSSILLRPHPTDTNAPQLSATSHIRVAVEEARVELLKWIAKRWLAIRQERGFDALEGWAIKEISDHIEVPINDLLNPPAYSSPKSQSPASAAKRAQGTGQRSTHSALLLRPISSHPHTSKVDPESDVASSMRVSVLSRNLPTRSVASSVRDRDRERAQSSASSVRSLARSTTESVASNSTVSATPRRRVAAGDASGPGMSPAKRLANEVRAGRGPGILDKDEDHDRPDSKLTPSASYVSLETVSSVAPSIVEPRGDDRYSMNEDGEYADGEEGYSAEEEDVTDEGYQEDMDVDHKEGDSILGDERSEYGLRDTEDRAQEDSPDGDAQTESDMYENAREELDPTSSRSSVTSSRVLKGKGTENPSTPVKKTLITRASLASVQSKKSALPSSTSPTNSTPGAARLKSSSASVNTST